MTVQEWACWDFCDRRGTLVAGCFASTGLRVRAEVLEMFRQDFVGGRLRVVAGLAMLDCSRPVRKQLKDNLEGN